MKNAYELTKGDKVTGHYHGHDFSGKVYKIMPHTINHNQLDIIVELDEPIEIWAQVRTAIIIPGYGLHGNEFKPERRLN